MVRPATPPPPTTHRRGHKIPIISRASATRASREWVTTTPTKPGEAGRYGNGPGRQSQSGEAREVEANYDSAQSQTPGALAAEEGITRPSAKTKSRRPGRRPLIHDNGEAVERSACSLLLPSNPIHTDRNQRSARPTRSWHGEMI